MKATCTLALLGGLVVNHVLASPLPPLVWTEAPGGVFVEGEACRFEAAGATAEAPCAVVGFLGERVAEGAFRSGSFETPPLGCGYYTLEAEGARPFAFAVVPPPETRTATRASSARHPVSKPRLRARSRPRASASPPPSPSSRCSSRTPSSRATPPSTTC